MTPGPPEDVNGVIGGLLRDLANIQTDRQKTFGYKRAAAVVLSLDAPLDVIAKSERGIPKIPGLGPASLRVVNEVVATGASATVEAAVAASGRIDDITRRRRLRARFLSRAAVKQVLDDSTFDGPSRMDYRGDLQMHSTWSDGVMSLAEIARACADRGYAFAAVTDHSRGLPIAGGMSDEAVLRQHKAIADVNQSAGDTFRLLRGVEANISADGALDLPPDALTSFEIVLAAPHSKLRIAADQTGRMLNAIAIPGVHVLAHPRGRISGSREGVVADWPVIFRRAAELGVAIEIDGDPSRQDLDYALAREACEAGCIFALDSDAHSTSQLEYAETALAHARLAAIPAAAIINCWPLDQLLGWSKDRRSAARPRSGSRRRKRTAPLTPATRA